MTLPRYGEYRDSTVEWLGQLPAHWELVRVKRIASSIEQGWSPQCENFPAETPDEWGVMKVGSTAFALTTQVLQFAEWTAAVMQQRQDAMLAKLEVHWRLQDRKSRVALAEALLAELESAGSAVVFELESSRHGLAAAAREDGEAFIVLAGSQAKLDWSGQPHSYEQLRKELRASGALKLSEDATHLVFAGDTPFKSPSAASATVLGRTTTAAILGDSKAPPSPMRPGRTICLPVSQRRDGPSRDLVPGLSLR